MQRLQQTLRAGSILGLVFCFAATADAQVYYVQSPSDQTLPITQSVVSTRTIVVPRYSYRSYVSTDSFGRFGSNVYRSSGLAWNNRRSAPPIYSETKYLPEVTHQSVVGVPTVAPSEPIYVSQPVETSVLIMSSPPVASSTRVIHEQEACRSEQIESKAKVTVRDSNGQVMKTLQSSAPKVTVSESNGRRVKTYRYEYELDQPSERVTIEFESPR